MASVSSYDEKRWRLSFFDKSKSPKRKAKYLKKKSYYKNYGYTKKQAETEAFRLEQLHKEGELDLWKENFDSKSLTIQEAIEVWIKKSNKRLAKSTIKARENRLNSFRDSFGNSYINNIDHNYIEKYINDIENLETRKSVYAAIKDLFKSIDKELNVSIVSTKKERLKNNKLSKTEWLTKEELHFIVNNLDTFSNKQSENKHATPHDYSYMKDILELAFFTGMRRGELFACRKEWVSEDYTKIKIGDDNFTPKSQHQFEIMPTIKEARPVLKRLSKINKGILIKKDPQLVSKNFKKIVRSLLPEKGEDLKFHSLRHSFVMYCLYELKLPEHVVMQLTRHKDRRSLQMYMHDDVNSIISLLNSL